MILVLNCGSQSVKYKLFDDKLVLIKKNGKRVNKKENYHKTLEEELKKLALFNKKIEKVCHRFVHGGEKFREPVLVNKRILTELKKINYLAPLHNPYNILGIEKSLRIFPRAKQVAVFDTGFYSHLKEEVFSYPLPEDIIKKYRFRKFGFHGISHEYVAKKGAEKIKKPFNKLKIISCHLGGGASITAIKNGKAVDTSMGFSPLEGLMMMTRSGEVDPGILIRLFKDFSPEKISDILNNFSGIKGVCGISDMKEVLIAIDKKNKKAELALKIFIYRIRKYIAAYYGLLNNCDLVIFTGAIGAGSEKIRKLIIKNFKILEKTKILVIETDEELLIAKKSKKI